MRIGVICPSEIAIRRFMPALRQCKDLIFEGIGVFSKEERCGHSGANDAIFENALKGELEKAQVFINSYGGKIYPSYEAIVSSPDIDAIYIPLPPALHFRWARKALECGKHVFVEKPATISLSDTKELISLAEKKNLALHENYMFIFHEQLMAIDAIVKRGEIGDVRLFRISFGFPRRAANDFRYNKALGGGALFDAGGYTIKLATRLLGSTAKLRYAQSNYVERCEVDMYGSASFVNDEGVTAQIAFGMDNNYKCELEIWGSKGTLVTGRILTAPAGFVPTAVLRVGNEEKIIDLPSDDTFLKSMRHFILCTQDDYCRLVNYEAIDMQATLVDEFTKRAGWE